MATATKKPTSPRVITCKKTGRTFEYTGKGRPPLYHPEVAAEIKKANATARRKEKIAANAVTRKAVKIEPAHVSGC